MGKSKTILPERPIVLPVEFGNDSCWVNLSPNDPLQLQLILRAELKLLIQSTTKLLDPHKRKDSPEKTLTMLLLIGANFKQVNNVLLKKKRICVKLSAFYLLQETVKLVSNLCQRIRLSLSGKPTEVRWILQVEVLPKHILIYSCITPGAQKLHLNISEQRTKCTLVWAFFALVPCLKCFAEHILGTKEDEQPELHQAKLCCVICEINRSRLSR